MRNRAAAFTALLLCCLAARFSEGAEDCGAKARDLLEKVSNKYEHMHAYDMAFEAQLPVDQPGLPGSVSAHIRLSSDGSDRTRAEFTATPQPGMDFRMLSVSNADTTWTLLAMKPLLNRYSAQAAASIDPDAPGTGLFQRVGDMFQRYVDLPQKAQSPCVSGEEVVPFMGRSVRCAMIEFDERSAPPTAGADSAHVTLWIDKKSSLVLKETSEAGGSVKTTELVRGTFGGEVSDTLFVFTPPADAERVDELVPGTRSDQPAGPAADFTLSDTEGNPVHLSDLQGKVVLLDFWATWCGPCRLELPSVRKIRSEFAEEDLAVLAVNVREKRQAVEAFVAKRGPLGFPILLDPSGAVSDLYRVRAIPTLVVIDRNGTIVWSHTGLTQEDGIRQAVKRAEAAQ